MRIEARVTPITPAPRTQSPVGDRGAASFSSAMAAAETGPAPAADGRPNFTSMTRQELRDWMNDKIRRGEMSLDESTPFLAMTMKMSTDGSFREVPAVDDAERIDFAQRIRDGIDRALDDRDDVMLGMLENAMRIMQRHGQGGGIDVRA